MNPNSTANGPGVVRSAIALVRRPAGRVKRALRAAVDGRLHPLRRRRAQKRLRSIPTPGRVLFVCLGNVCRSPYAEAQFRKRSLESGLSVGAASSGFIGPGRPPPDPAVRLASSRGLDTSGHRSRLTTTELVTGTGLVVVMEARQARRLRSRAGGTPLLVLGDLDPRTVTRRSIRDPWNGSEPVYADVFDRIDRCVEELVRLLLDGDHTPPPERNTPAPARAAREG